MRQRSPGTASQQNYQKRQEEEGVGKGCGSPKADRVELSCHCVTSSKLAIKTAALETKGTS